MDRRGLLPQGAASFQGDPGEVPRRSSWSGSEQGSRLCIRYQPVHRACEPEQAHRGSQPRSFKPHLERIVSILDSPPNYGIRLEFLDIQMTKEEQLAFFAHYASTMDQFGALVQTILAQLSQPALSKAIPVSQLNAFKATLESIVGPPGYFPSIFPHPMERLKVPLQELKEFEAILNRITGGQFPKLAFPKPSLSALQTLPLELMQIDQSLDQILWKLERINKLKSGL